MASFPLLGWLLAILLILAWAWISVKRKPLSPSLVSQSVALGASAIIISLVLGVAASLAFTGAPSSLLVAVVALPSTIAIAFGTRLPQGSQRGGFDWLVTALAASIGLLSFGSQMDYASFWGDVGVYRTASEHFANNGRLPLYFDTDAQVLLEKPSAMSPLNGLNPAPGGGFHFHALPTFPGIAALLRVSRDIAGVLSILFALAILQMYVLARLVTRAPTGAIMAAAMVATLPLAWFLTMYATAELLLLVLAQSFLLLSYFARRNPLLLSLPLLAYGTVHVGVVLLAPLVASYLFLTLLRAETARQRRAYSAAAIACGSAGGLAVWYGYSVSTKYVSDIAAALFGGSIPAMALIAMSPALALVGGVKKSGRFSLLHRCWSLLSNANLAKAFVFCLVVVVAIQGYILGWTDLLVPHDTSQYNSWSARSAYVNRGFASLAHLSVLNLTLAVAGVGMAAFVALPFMRATRENAGSRRQSLLWASAAYAVLVYAILRIDIPNNYYASRYFLPVAMPLLLLLGSLLIERSKWAMRGSVVMCAVGLWFVSALISGGYYVGTTAFRDALMSQFPRGTRLVTSLGAWGTYLVFPALLTEVGKSDGSPSLLITDSAYILGRAQCSQFQAREIPWQIGYLLSPSVTEQRLCVVHPASSALIDLGQNKWTSSGELGGVIARPPTTGKVRITIESLGWWRSAPSFRNDVSALSPRLEVCGQDFTLATLTSVEASFEGSVSADFCKWKYTTSTFRPVEEGMGSDARSLGMDVIRIRMAEI